MIKRIWHYLLRHPLFPLSVKTAVLRRSGTVGKGFKMGGGSFIYAREIHIGHNVNIGRNVQIYSDVVIIGNDTVIQNDTTIEAKKRVEIGDECIISQQVIIGGGQTSESSFYMGKRVHVYPFCFLNTTKPLVLEDGVGIGGGCYIFTHGSWQDAYEGFPYAFAPVTIKKNAWLPWRVFVMPGITIGEEATIGSDALITKDIPSRSFAVGVPAKVLKQGEEYIKVMTPEKKVELMAEILHAFAEQQNCFKGMNATFKQDGAKLSLLFDSGIEIIYDTSLQRTEPGRLLLTELASDEEISSHVFDLRNKRCKWPLTALETDLHSFITNYGIRLDISGKYA